MTSAGLGWAAPRPAAFGAGAATQRSLSDQLSYITYNSSSRNPADSAAGLSVAVLLPLALVSQVARYRAGEASERLQIRWLLWSAAVFFALAVAQNLTYEFQHPALRVAVAIGFVSLPASVGVAVLRYHLWEIDRIVSRTVTYGVVALVLVGVYVTLVIAPTAVTVGRGDGGNGGPPAVWVAAATLAAAAAFNPIRRRVQQAVDRRFNRARYDAEWEAAAYAGRLRAGTAWDAVGTDLIDAVTRTVAPSSTGLWLRSDPGTSRNDPRTAASYQDSNQEFRL